MYYWRHAFHNTVINSHAKTFLVTGALQEDAFTSTSSSGISYVTFRWYISPYNSIDFMILEEMLYPNACYKTMVVDFLFSVKWVQV